MVLIFVEMSTVKFKKQKTNLAECVLKCWTVKLDHGTRSLNSPGGTDDKCTLFSKILASSQLLSSKLAKILTWQIMCHGSLLMFIACKS